MSSSSHEGGGSTTDLWCFNDEQLARTIASCKVPVVSAIGHEVDYTIADFVADVRAPTPSAAAEYVVPEFAYLTKDTEELTERLFRACTRNLRVWQQALDVDTGKLESLMGNDLLRSRQALATLTQKLTEQHPRAKLVRFRSDLGTLHLKLTHVGRQALQERKQSLARMVGKLESLSPLQVLSRGYAVTTTVDGHVLRSSSEVSVGEHIHVRLHEGELACTIDRVADTESPKE